MQNAPSPPPQWVQPWGPPPYRQPPANAWPAPPVRRPASKPVPFRPKELAAILAIGLASDLSLYGADGLGAGGHGLALLFVVVPAAAFVAARARRVTTRTAVIVALLGIVALRCAYAPTTGTVLAGLGLSFVFALAIRARKVFIPDAIVSALSAIAKLPSRIGAAVSGMHALAGRTRLGRVSVLPVAVPLALSAVFAGVFALANPIVAHALDIAWDAIARVLGFLPRPASSCGASRLHPALRSSGPRCGSRARAKPPRRRSKRARSRSRSRATRS